MRTSIRIWTAYVISAKIHKNHEERLPGDRPSLALLTNVVAITGPYRALALKNALTTVRLLLTPEVTAMLIGGGI